MTEENNVVSDENEDISAPETAERPDPECSESEKDCKSDKKKAKKLESKIAEFEGALGAKEKELAEQNDKYMRMMAEYDNFRKRSAKEKEGAYADAYADALNSILPIIDNLERAVGVTDAEGVLKGRERIELARHNPVRFALAGCNHRSRRIILIRQKDCLIKLVFRKLLFAG